MFRIRPVIPCTNLFLAEKEIMYIGETENRGVAICPKQAPQHAKLQVTHATTNPTTSTTVAASSKKHYSPNFALITSAVTAAVLVTLVALVTAIKVYLREKR